MVSSDGGLHSCYARASRPRKSLRQCRVIGMVFLHSGIRAMHYITIIGLIAAFCSSMAFLPQVLHTIRTRSTADISLKMYSLYSFGIFMWLIYGLLLRDVPIILSNTLTLALSGTILLLKLRHG
jgi:MtN3 and saliva related transmembrane protein